MSVIPGTLEFTLKYMDPAASPSNQLLPELLQATIVTFHKSLKEDKQETCLVPKWFLSDKLFPIQKKKGKKIPTPKQ